MEKIAALIIMALCSVTTVSGCITNPGVPCKDLPTMNEVLSVVSEHNDVVMQMKDLSKSNSIWVDVDYERCPGKADLIIYYGTESEKQEIKKIIGDTFFGIPYRMMNV